MASVAMDMNACFHDGRNLEIGNTAPTIPLRYTARTPSHMFRELLGFSPKSGHFVATLTSGPNHEVRDCASRGPGHICPLSLSTGSAARRRLQIIAAGLFEDILQGLDPDWCLHSGEGVVSTPRRKSQAAPPAAPVLAEIPSSRPEALKLFDRVKITLEVKRLRDWRNANAVYTAAFKKHHYLSGGLVFNGHHFLMRMVEGPFQPGTVVGFYSSCVLVGRVAAHNHRESRIVVLPQFQGHGIGPRWSNAMAAAHMDSQIRFHGTTAHPRLGGYRDNYKLNTGHTLWAPNTNNQKATTATIADNLLKKRGAPVDPAAAARKPRVCWRHHYVGEDLQKYRALLALIEQKAQEEVENKRKLQEVGAKICFPVWLSSRFLASFCIFS